MSGGAGMRAILLAGLLAGVVYAQPPDPQPLYRVTVISRSLEAVNYEHRGGPSPLDFQGTVLLPHMKGTAIVESQRGSVAIDAKFEHLEAPTRFGREYLTYVLWAISPEGRARNLGEVVVDSSNKAHVKVTTDLQAFGLMITAEPYFSVSTPSDVVVAENVVRPDTIGAREMVNAKYELLPRGQYTMNLQAAQLRSMEGGEKLPYDRYEAVLELYQAENAVQIARSLGADRYAPESIGKATTLLTQARPWDSAGSARPRLARRRTPDRPRRRTSRQPARWSALRGSHARLRVHLRSRPAIAARRRRAPGRRRDHHGRDFRRRYPLRRPPAPAQGRLTP